MIPPFLFETSIFYFVNIVIRHHQFNTMTGLVESIISIQKSAVVPFNCTIAKREAVFICKTHERFAMQLIALYFCTETKVILNCLAFRFMNKFSAIIYFYFTQIIFISIVALKYVSATCRL